MTDERASELRAYADAWRAARDAERARMAELSAAIAAAASDMTEAEIVRATDINRVTVRKAMGKDQQRTNGNGPEHAQQL